MYTSKTISNRVWQTQQNNGRVLQIGLLLLLDFPVPFYEFAISCHFPLNWVCHAPPVFGAICWACCVNFVLSLPYLAINFVEFSIILFCWVCHTCHNYTALLECPTSIKHLRTLRGLINLTIKSAKPKLLPYDPCQNAGLDNRFVFNQVTQRW